MDAFSSLPRLSYPFQAEVSPYAERVDQQTFRWGRDVGIFETPQDAERYRNTRVGWLAGRTSPRSSLDGLQLLADWQMWLFAFDDTFCDESATGDRPDLLAQAVTRYLGIIERAQPHPGCDPFAAALADLADRLQRCATPVQRARFAHAVTGYFLAQCWEAANRRRHSPPELAEYIYMRRHSGAVPTCMALIDVAGGFSLTPEEFDDPMVASLAECATNVACWANDILSYPKEISRSSVVHSLPAVLSAEFGIGTTEALQRAAVMHDQEVTRYEAAEHAVREHASPELHRYLDDLRFWMRGTRDWPLETERYTHPGYVSTA